MRQDARRDGYELIGAPELQKLLKTGKGYVLIDVRPDYEFQAGHIPGALNLEFHLGDRLKLGPEKKLALQTMVGPDQNRTVILYCRSYS